MGFEGYGSGSKQVLALEPEIRSRAGTYFCFISNRQPAAGQDSKSSFESPCNKFWLSQMRLKELKIFQNDRS